MQNKLNKNGLECTLNRLYNPVSTVVSGQLDVAKVTLVQSVNEESIQPVSQLEERYP